MNLVLSLGSMALALHSLDPYYATEKFQCKVHAHLPGASVQYGEAATVEDAETLEVNTAEVERTDMIHLLYGMARKFWLEHETFPVHGACVGNPSTGYYLIVGENGAGKSTTTLNLIANHGFKLFSGDKTLVKIDESGKMLAIAGTKVMTTRNDTEIPGLGTLISKDTLVPGDRNIFQLKSEYVEPRGTVEIKGIYAITAYHTVERNTDLADSGLFVVFPHFFDQQRADVILGMGKRVFHGDIDQKIKERDVRLFSKAMKVTRIRNITGSLEFVSSEIAKDMKRDLE